MAEKLKINDVIDIVPEKMVYGGSSIARIQNQTVFVYGALQKENIQARIYRKRKGVFYAETLNVSNPSKDRIESRCPHFGECGGCTWQHIDYQAQLKYKQHIFTDVLSRIAGINDTKVGKIVPSPLEFGYRNKMEFSFGKNSEGVFIGHHRRGRYDQLLPTAKDCFLVPEKVREIVSNVEEMAQEEEAHDPRTGSGYLRFFNVRWSFHEERAILGITITQDIDLNIFKSWFIDLAEKFPGVIAGGYVTINYAGSSSIGKFHSLFGNTEFIERIGEKSYVVGAMSFFQTNPIGAKNLFDFAREFADLSGNERLWDLYCGAGTIGIYLSDDAAFVLGIENEESAIACAKINAELNNVGEKVIFLYGDVAKVLLEIREKRLYEKPDCIVIDPPRAGLPSKTVRRMMRFKPKRIIYITCNPSTFARDISVFSGYGYSLIKVQPVDMFPQTYHIEAVGLLKRS